MTCFCTIKRGENERALNMALKNTLYINLLAPRFAIGRRLWQLFQDRPGLEMRMKLYDEQLRVLYSFNRFKFITNLVRFV